MKIGQNYVREELYGEQRTLNTSHGLSDVTVQWIAILPITLKFDLVIDCNS